MNAERCQSVLRSVAWYCVAQAGQDQRASAIRQVFADLATDIAAPVFVMTDAAGEQTWRVELTPALSMLDRLTPADRSIELNAIAGELVIALLECGRPADVRSRIERVDPGGVIACLCVRAGVMLFQRHGEDRRRETLRLSPRRVALVVGGCSTQPSRRPTVTRGRRGGTTATNGVTPPAPWFLRRHPPGAEARRVEFRAFFRAKKTG